nr:hypothetical protein BgiMline_013992 [Biomphalaria glabrata]
MMIKELILIWTAITACEGADLIMEITEGGDTNAVILDEPLIRQFHSCICTNINTLCKIPVNGMSVIQEIIQDVNVSYHYDNTYFCFHDAEGFTCYRLKAISRIPECSSQNERCSNVALVAKGNTCTIGTVNLLWSGTKTVSIKVFSETIRNLFSCVSFCSKQEPVAEKPADKPADQPASEVIIGLSVGASVVILILALVIIILCFKMKKRQILTINQSRPPMPLPNGEQNRQQAPSRLTVNTIENESTHYESINYSIHEYLEPIQFSRENVLTNEHRASNSDNTPSNNSPDDTRANETSISIAGNDTVRYVNERETNIDMASTSSNTVVEVTE